MTLFYVNVQYWTINFVLNFQIASSFRDTALFEIFNLSISLLREVSFSSTILIWF